MESGYRKAPAPRPIRFSLKQDILAKEHELRDANIHRGRRRKKRRYTSPMPRAGCPHRFAPAKSRKCMMKQLRLVI